MNSARREQILEAYTRHVQRFDEIAARPFHSTGLFAPNETVRSSPACASTTRRCELYGLSGREQEVLSLVAWGYSNDEISAKLRVTLETVKTHVHHILGRLGARNRAHAVHLGYERGLLLGNPSAPGAQ